MQNNAPRHGDGSAGDADYGAIGTGYANFRRPDPRIAELIEVALAGARTVLNVGAGAGSYEPVGRTVTPVEPSQSMREQRPTRAHRRERHILDIRRPHLVRSGQEWQSSAQSPKRLSRDQSCRARAPNRCPS